jgi:hypothetical protein
VSRRVSLPTADDLFPSREAAVAAVPDPGSDFGSDLGAELGFAPGPDGSPAEASGPRRRHSSGRVRHDEKMTVYVTAGELLDLELARLSLRRDQGLAVDRGRLVREAIAMALADLETNGDDSDLVRRLVAR